jgi:propanol-preferring alcohol dehydrogenase
MTLHGYRVEQWGSEPVWGDLPDPVAGPGEVLIDVEACGVGLTVLNCINGDLDNSPDLLPRIPGHELVGRVVDAGPGADSSLVGKRVVAYFYLTCGTCASCLAGRDPQCSNLGGFVGVHRDGGYAPKVALPGGNVIVVPEGLDPVAATVVPDAVATPVHVAERAGIGPGDRVAVFGAGGGVGIHMIQVARLRGATVAGLDLAKFDEIESLGARPVDASNLTSVSNLFDDGPPTVVIDLVGTAATARWGIDHLAMGGRLVMLATFPNRPVPIEARETVFRELSIFGSRYSWKSQVAEAARLVADGSIKPIISEVRGPGALPELHDLLRAGELVGRGALDWSLT